MTINQTGAGKRREHERGATTMSMSKKDFIALADALKESQPLFPTDLQRKQWEQDCWTIADVCQASNPHFKRDRWLNYIADKCGPSGGSKKAA